jgi:peptidoglycan/LPS O-acetylase OafA/YrhL
MSDGKHRPLANLPQDGTAHRQKYWGLGLAVLGFILEWMVLALVHRSMMVTLGLTVAVGICASGIGYYSRAKGSRVTWGVVGFVPIFGFLLFLFLFPLVTGFRKNWAGFVLSLVGFGMFLAIFIPNYLN